MPPLRDRAEDIPELVAHFLSRISDELHRPLPKLTRAALRKLTSFSWPGNVRQLEHVLTKALALSDADGSIGATDIDLPHAVAAPQLSRAEFERAEAERIATALAENRYNVSKVARLLDIPRATLYRRMARYGLSAQ